MRSPPTRREHAPKQGHEGAPEARIAFEPRVLPALASVRTGDGLLVLAWLHEADREPLQVHPRDDPRAPLTGVFGTRSQERPHPTGVHRVRATAIMAPTALVVAGLEAVDGTPMLDVKVALDRTRGR